MKQKNAGITDLPAFFLFKLQISLNPITGFLSGVLKTFVQCRKIVSELEINN